MSESPIHLERRDIAAAAFLAVALFITGSCRMFVGVCGTCHDDAIYVITAKSLAQGDGYRLTNLPGSPLQTKYPVLYPAVLAALWAAWPVFPDNLLLLQGLSLISGAVALAISYLYGVRCGYFTRSVAFLAGLLCASTPAFIVFTTVTMSEMLFALLLVLALWRTDAILRAAHGQPGFGDGILLALPFLCRSIGIVLFPATLLAFGFARRPLRRVVLGMLAAALPWVIWAKGAALTWGNNPVLGYYTDYFGWWKSFGLSQLGHLILENVFSLVTSISAMLLEGIFKPLFEFGSLYWLLAFTVLGIVALIPLVRDLTRVRVLPACLVAYFLVVVVWPWPPQRFLIPLLPLLAAYLVRGSVAILNLFLEYQSSRRLAVWAACGFAIAANVILFTYHCQKRYQLGTPQPELGTRAASWNENETALAWLVSHTSPDDVIAAGNDPMIALYTGRLAFYPIVCPPEAVFDEDGDADGPLPDIDQSVQTLEAYRPRYLALMPNFHGEGYFRRWVRELVRRYPDCVRLVYQGGDKRYSVFELHYPFVPPAIEQPSVPLASADVIDFTLRDEQNGVHRLSDLHDSPVVVVAFLGAECPLAKLYAPRLVELAHIYAPRGVAFLAAGPNEHDSAADLTHYAKEHHLPFPVLKDVDNVVADRLGVRRTPEVIVLDKNRVIRYRGRIDDQHAVGTRKTEPTRNDLAEALNDLLAGHSVRVPVTEASGCLIDRVRKSAKSGTVTWCRDIAPIVQQHCQVCHRKGEIAPFELRTYKDASSWAAMIREVVTSGRMPPWGADPTHGRFSNDPSLTSQEKQKLLDWIDADCPKGNVADLPSPATFPEGFIIGQADVVLSMPHEFQVPAQGVIEYQTFVVDPGFQEDRWIQAAEVRPGNRKVVHHCNVFLQPPGFNDLREEGALGSYCLAATAQGTPPMVLPDGMAKRVPAGWKLVFVVHYVSIGTPQTDRTSIALKFADPATVRKEVATKLMLEPNLRIPSHEPNYRVEQTWRINDDVLLLAFFPHMHLRGKSFRYEAIYPDESQEILLNVPHFDFGWQPRYALAEPKRLPAGSLLRCTAVYDNSEANPANPDASQWVYTGTQSWEEMFNGYFDVALAKQDLTQPTPWYNGLLQSIGLRLGMGNVTLLLLIGIVFLVRRPMQTWLESENKASQQQA